MVVVLLLLQGADLQTPPSPRDSAHSGSAHRGDSAHQALFSAFRPASGPAQLVLRRGQKFTIELEFDRPYDKLKDDIIFTFQFGEMNTQTRGQGPVA